MTKVLPSEWDAPDHLSLSEREFLVDRAETINGIIAASYLQCGQVLLQVKKKFKSDPDLKGWFTRWCDETLPFQYAKANQLIKIAEEVSEDPTLLQLTKEHSYTSLFRALLLPGEFRSEVLRLMREGQVVSDPKIRELRQTPEAQLAAAQEMYEQVEATLLRYELSSDKKDISQRSHQRKRLAKALQQLQEKQAAVDNLEKTRSTQELVLLQLQKQLKKSQVQIENMSLDPEQNRKRDLARTVVDATRSLDMLLATIDRYGTDKPELGEQAIETIERKMEEVKNKLLNQYGATT